MKAAPSGIDLLIKKAAVDGAFRERPIEGRAACAGEIGLELSRAEITLLRAVSREQLAKMIGVAKVPESAVPALLGKVAALMVAALGTSDVTGQAMTFGHGGDYPPQKPFVRPAESRPSPKPVATKPSADAAAEKKKEWGGYRVTFKDGREVRCNYEDGGDHYTLVFETSRRWVDKEDVRTIEAVGGPGTQAATSTQPGTEPGTQTKPATQTQPATAPLPQDPPRLIAGVMPG